VGGNLKIRKQDKAEYNRLKKNIKSKIKYTQDKHGLDISDLIELPSLDSFSRKDFNLWKKQATTFTKSKSNKVKRNEHGVPYTDLLVKTYKQRAEKANDIKEKFNEIFKDKPFLSKGVKTGITIGQYDFLMKESDDLGNLTRRDFNIGVIKTMRDLERNRNRINEEQDIEFYHTSMDDMRGNWILSLRKQFNSDADNLVKLVNQISAGTFYELYKQNKEMAFSFIYTEGDDETITLLEGLFSDALKGNIDLDLKGFPDTW
jgi:hypothetical protein